MNIKYYCYYLNNAEVYNIFITSNIHDILILFNQIIIIAITKRMNMEFYFK